MFQSVDKTANSTILVVASDSKFLKFLETALKLEFEYEIHSLTRGIRAVDLAIHVKPVLFIIDYHLLDISVLELSLQLHNIKELENVPTIILNSPVTSWRVPQPHNTTFLAMQFSLEELYSTVNEYLGLN